MADAASHAIRSKGNTLIEAEDYSNRSEQFPYAEPCKKCSGQHNLGFFWKDSWFELEVVVAMDNRFDLSLRASSATGTSIALFTMGEDSQEPTQLDVVQVPKTTSWNDYIVTEKLQLTLPAGKHRLRFRNLVDGANVDYITFSAKSDTLATNGLGQSLTVVHPPKNQGADKNPLKGFGSGWWREKDDYATVGFQYIEWGRLEPKDDQFDWDYVEEVLAREGTRGRHLILQFVVDWDYREPLDENYVGPDWLLKMVGEHKGHADEDDPSSRPMRATKYNHPQYEVEAVEAIEALTGYFKNDPRVFILQAGLLGFWSEWHTFPREDWSPNVRTKQAVMKAYLNNLPEHVFTQIRYPNEATVKPRYRVGYTNGSATPTDHGYEFGQQIEARSLWKNGPITGEWPPNVEEPFWQRFFQTDEGQKFIDQGHYSTLLMPEPKHIKEQIADWAPEDRFMDMHRSLGYKLQADRVRHVFTDDGHLNIELTLANAGIAPFYQDWNLQLAILDGTSSEVRDLLPVEADLRKLAPGDTMTLKAKGNVKLNQDVLHRIAFRILQPMADAGKSEAWLLEARNTYVVLANEIDVIAGKWNDQNALEGGWNVLAPIQSTLTADTASLPFEGSFRPRD